jgi:glutamine cyclotransferase
LRVRSRQLTRRRASALWASFALAIGAATAGAGATDADATPPTRPVEVRAVHPHDPRAFTQGLVWQGGRLYESLGLRGRSAVREVEIASGRVLRETALPPDQFGEGLALAGERLFQLTWQQGVAHSWRRTDFAPLGDFGYAGEGWGLAWDGSQLIQSDGSDVLRFRSPEDFRATRELRVTLAGRPAAYLNELEFVGDSIYANVWQSDQILRIDPASGRVLEIFDATGLLTDEEAAKADVLNGIAWNPEKRVFYITGKLWPKLFEVDLPRAAPDATMP